MGQGLEEALGQDAGCVAAWLCLKFLLSQRAPWHSGIYAIWQEEEEEEEDDTEPEDVTSTDNPRCP